MCLRLLALLFVLVFSLASPAQTSEKTKADSVPDTCPVTKPSEKPLIPPPPYPIFAAQVTSKVSFWYGTNSLWTSLPTGGVRRLARQDNGSYLQKLFLWQEGYDWRKEPRPDIVVILRRLDRNTPSIISRGGTNAFFDDSWAMLTGVRFPTEGCWEITSLHDGHQLTFVLSIQGPD